MLLTCALPACGKEFQTRLRIPPRKYCSFACSAAARSKPPEPLPEYTTQQRAVPRRQFGTSLPKSWTGQQRRKALALWRSRGRTVEEIAAIIGRPYRSVLEFLTCQRGALRPDAPTGAEYAVYQRHLARHQLAVEIAAVRREARRTAAYKPGLMTWR